MPLSMDGTLDNGLTTAHACLMLLIVSLSLHRLKESITANLNFQGAGKESILTDSALRWDFASQSSVQRMILDTSLKI